MIKSFVTDDVIYEKLHDNLKCLVLRDFDPEQDSLSDLLSSEEDKSKMVIFGTSKWSGLGRNECYFYSEKIFICIQYDQQESIEDFTADVIKTLWDMNLDVDRVTFGSLSDEGKTSVKCSYIYVNQPHMMG